MKLHAYRHDASTSKWVLNSTAATAADAPEFLSLDKPTLLILPGAGNGDASQKHGAAISKVLAMVSPGHHLKHLSPSVEASLAHPHDPDKQLLNCVLFSWQHSNEDIVAEGILESSENHFTHSDEAAALAAALWEAVRRRSKTQTPSKEAIISALSNLTIFTHSYGSIFGEKLSLELSNILSQQSDPAAGTKQAFSEQDIRDILRSVVQVNIASMSNLSHQNKRSFSQYNFCAINDDDAFGFIEAVYSKESLDKAQKIAAQIGYPPVELTEMELFFDQGLRATKDHLSVHRRPCGVVISDFISDSLGPIHTARVHTTRGPHQRGYADIFERIICNALTRKGPFGDALEPLLQPTASLFPVAHDSDSNPSVRDRLVTSCVQTAIDRGMGKEVTCTGRG